MNDALFAGRLAAAGGGDGDIVAGKGLQKSDTGRRRFGQLGVVVDFDAAFLLADEFCFGEEDDPG